MWWIIGTLIYLAIGFYFKSPSSWKWYTKVLAHIFWLPLVLFLIIIIRFGGGPKIM